MSDATLGRLIERLLAKKEDGVGIGWWWWWWGGVECWGGEEGRKRREAAAVSVSVSHRKSRVLIV